MFFFIEKNTEESMTHNMIDQFTVISCNHRQMFVGLTGQDILNLCKLFNIKYKVRQINLQHLFNHRFCGAFLTSSVRGIALVETIDHYVFNYEHDTFEFIKFIDEKFRRFVDENLQSC